MGCGICKCPKVKKQNKPKATQIQQFQKTAISPEEELKHQMDKTQGVITAKSEDIKNEYALQQQDQATNKIIEQKVSEKGHVIDIQKEEKEQGEIIKPAENIKNETIQQQPNILPDGQITVLFPENENVRAQQQEDKEYVIIKQTENVKNEDQLQHEKVNEEENRERQIGIQLGYENKNSTGLILQRTNYESDQKHYTNDENQLYKIKDEFSAQKLLSTISPDHFVNIFNQEQYLIKGHWHNLIEIVLEFCERGDMNQELSRRKEQKNPFSEAEIKQLIEQLVEGGALMQENNISHMDIKPHNIFVTRDGKFKFGNFGKAAIQRHINRKNQQLEHSNISAL